jgi:hypothetical protein
MLKDLIAPFLMRREKSSVLLDLPVRRETVLYTGTSNIGAHLNGRYFGAPEEAIQGYFDQGFIGI